MRRPLRLVLGLAVCAWPTLAAAEGPVIEHAAVGCAVAGQFPRFDARVASPAGIARAMLLFRSSDEGRHWYAVAMRPEGGKYAAFLPRPKKSLKAFRYYIEATDIAFGINRTEEFVTDVATGPGGCSGKVMAGTAASASVLIEVPAGAAALPPGFAPLGVTTTAAASAAAGVAAGTSAATGGGIGAGKVLLVGGVAAAAAGTVVAVKAAVEGGDEDKPCGAFEAAARNPGAFVVIDIAGQTICSTRVCGIGPLKLKNCVSGVCTNSCAGYYEVPDGRRFDCPPLQTAARADGQTLKNCDTAGNEFSDPNFCQSALQQALQACR